MIMSEQSAAMNTALKRCPTAFKVTVFRKGKTKQVLFLEARKDFVDTLLSFLLLPVGTVHHILSQGIQVKYLSGISSIFESVDFLKLHVDKQDLVQPRPSAPGCTACRSSCSSVPFLRDLEAAGILRPERQVLSKYYFKCVSQECSGLSSERGERCEKCKLDGPYAVQMKDPYLKEVSRSKSGLVKENTNFIVNDKLEIRPSSTMAIMNVLRKLEFAPVDDLERSEIAVSMGQILQLLHSARTSNSCLNDVFGLQKPRFDFMQLVRLGLFEAATKPKWIPE